MASKSRKSSGKRKLKDEIIVRGPIVRHGDAHGDEGSGHFDFGGHSDLHLDIHIDNPEMLARDAGVEVSLELREAMEKWIQLVNERLMKIERRIDALSGKK